VLKGVLYLVPYETRVMYGVYFSTIQNMLFKRKKRCGKLKKGGDVEGLNVNIVNFYINCWITPVF
jgi:hypothetical protein